jgi:acetyl esterase/lipase
MGDSAGAHLSLNVTAALARAGVPGPGGLALASPWVDYTQSTRSWRANTDDYLSSRWIRWSIASITRWYTPDAVQGPVFSPARAPAGAHKHLQDKPVFVSVGTEETLVDEVRALVRNLRGDGVKATVYDDEGGLHDAPTFTPLFGTEESYKAFADGVNAVLGQIGK